MPEAPPLIAVLTCPRPRGASYLAGTLKAVDAEVAVDRLLVCDGVPAPAPPGWAVAVLPERPRAHQRWHDNIEPGWFAMAAALSKGTDLLLIEDDVRPVRPGVFADMLSHRVPAACAWTSFFATLRGPGVFPAGLFQQSQAVLIPNRTLTVLVASKSDPILSGQIWVDLAMAYGGSFYGWRFEQAATLVEHIGIESAAVRRAVVA